MCKEKSNSLPVKEHHVTFETLVVDIPLCKTCIIVTDSNGTTKVCSQRPKKKDIQIRDDRCYYSLDAAAMAAANDILCLTGLNNQQNVVEYGISIYKKYLGRDLYDYYLTGIREGSVDTVDPDKNIRSSVPQLQFAAHVHSHSHHNPEKSKLSEQVFSGRDYVTFYNVLKCPSYLVAVHLKNIPNWEGKSDIQCKNGKIINIENGLLMKFSPPTRNVDNDEKFGIKGRTLNGLGSPYKNTQTKIEPRSAESKLLFEKYVEVASIVSIDSHKPRSIPLDIKVLTPFLWTKIDYPYPLNESQI